jgi:hypothetical protein
MKNAQGCSGLILGLVKLIDESVNDKLIDFPRTLPAYTKRTFGCVIAHFVARKKG